jgi:hypothetical protein
VPESVSAYTAVRDILREDLDLDTDEVIARARARGASRPDAAFRRIVVNTRSELRLGGKAKKPAKPAPLSAYTLAREALADEPELSTDDLVTRLKARGITKKDPDIREIIRKTRGEIRRKAKKAEGATARPIPVPSAAAVTVPPPAVTPVAPAPAAADPFAGVRLANRTAAACGGIAKAREIAEAIRTVGGIDAFLERLDLVADILGSDTKM